MNSCDFTLGHYADLIGAALRADYRFVTFDEVAGMPDVSAAGRLFLMRHDIDVCPTTALRMAELEHQLGVSATYFFLTTSPYYNVTSAPIRSVLERITELGGRVELHFDTLSCRPGQDAVDAVREQATVLEQITNRPVRALSFHRPAPELLGCDVNGMICTYGPRFFKEIRYVSDSAMNWRDGCACNHLDGKPIHCLVHPIWWSQGPGGVADRVHQFLSDNRHRHDEWLAAEIRSYNGPRQSVEPTLLPAP